MDSCPKYVTSTELYTSKNYKEENYLYIFETVLLTVKVTVSRTVSNNIRMYLIIQ